MNIRNIDFQTLLISQLIQLVNLYFKWARTGFDLNWISMLQAEEVPGFYKRHKLVHGKNKNRVQAFSPVAEKLALAA